MPVPKDSTAFTDTLADILRLYFPSAFLPLPKPKLITSLSPDETLAMSYIYLNKYRRFFRTSQTPDPLDPYVRLPSSTGPPNLLLCLRRVSILTPHPILFQTLALATLSLASKATECPRRLRAILLPAHRLLHPLPPAPNTQSKTQHNTPPNPLAAPLTIPSETYDTLRATLVQAELILLRVLGFELRLASPMDFLGRYLERAMEGVEAGEDYEGWGREERMEYGVEEGGWRTMRVGRGVWGWGLRA